MKDCKANHYHNLPKKYQNFDINLKDGIVLV